MPCLASELREPCRLGPGNNSLLPGHLSLSLFLRHAWEVSRSFRAHAVSTRPVQKGVWIFLQLQHGAFPLLETTKNDMGDARFMKELICSFNSPSVRKELDDILFLSL